MQSGEVQTADIIEHSLDRSDIIDFGPGSFFDRCYATPAVLGKGTVRVLRVDEDIGFFFVKHGASEDFVTTDTDFKGPYIKIGWILRIAKTSAWYDGLPKMTVTSRVVLVGSASGVNKLVDPPLVPTEIANLFISPIRVAECLELGDTRLSPLCDRIIYEPKGEAAYTCSVFSSMAELALLQVENCPFEGNLKRLYLEGKALELVALAFHDVQKSPERSKAGPSRIDVKRIWRIQEYLDHNLRSPPSLRELASWAGISAAKLKRDYKAVFGYNAYQYVVMRRMDEARRFIGKDGMSVKEAAYLCGYKSMTHFSRTYKRRFGYNPSETA